MPRKTKIKKPKNTKKPKIGEMANLATGFIVPGIKTFKQGYMYLPSRQVNNGLTSKQLSKFQGLRSSLSNAQRRLKKKKKLSGKSSSYGFGSAFNMEQNSGTAQQVVASKESKESKASKASKASKQLGLPVFDRSLPAPQDVVKSAVFNKNLNSQVRPREKKWQKKEHQNKRSRMKLKSYKSNKRANSANNAILREVPLIMNRKKRLNAEETEEIMAQNITNYILYQTKTDYSLNGIGEILKTFGEDYMGRQDTIKFKIKEKYDKFEDNIDYNKSKNYNKLYNDILDIIIDTRETEV